MLASAKYPPIMAIIIAREGIFHDFLKVGQALNPLFFFILFYFQRRFLQPETALPVDAPVPLDGGTPATGTSDF